ncbi:hypothetical protein CVV72_12810 [Amycolatopsis sp. TNS106]|nr:hypothetical protein CVV72_12810 [Amycolatopsis sp. TNS106]
MEWEESGAGGWFGRLPLWPFERSAPPGLAELTGGMGLLVHLRYGHAYPAAAPRLEPLDPKPPLDARTDQRWHVLGDGNLCLMQSPSQWTGRESPVGLLLKAAGWRVEYELMSCGAIDAMTINGIVDDAVLDDTIAELAHA